MASQEEIDYKQKYRSLKKKLRFLIYEQECFHEELRRSQRKLLKVSRDKSFLLDRLMQYERVEESASSAESTDSSDADTKKAAAALEKKQKKKAKKRKKKLTQMKPEVTQDNSEKTPMLANLAFSSTLTQQMSQQIAELMSKGTSNLPGSSTQPFAGLGSTGKQSQSSLTSSSSTTIINQPSTSSNTGLSSSNILERALSSPGNLSSVSLGNQTTPTSSLVSHSAGTADRLQAKKKVKRESTEKPSFQSSPKIKIEDTGETSQENLIMDLPE
ncbi:uncharacterized protein [Amphiura filiformis]